MAYANAVIETETTRYERGDTVNRADIDGYDELVESGAIADTKPEPVTVSHTPPDVIEVDGVVYKKASDGATNGEASS